MGHGEKKNKKSIQQEQAGAHPVQGITGANLGRVASKKPPDRPPTLSTSEKVSVVPIS